MIKGPIGPAGLKWVENINQIPKLSTQSNIVAYSPIFRTHFYGQPDQVVLEILIIVS